MKTAKNSLRINYFNQAICLFLISLFLGGCAPLKKIVPFKSQAANVTAKGAPSLYSGLKAKIALTDFEVEANKATPEVGVALRQVLAAAFINSRHFNVAEHPPADLIISATIAEFEPQTSGGSLGIGGGGGGTSGLFGGLLGTKTNKAHIALDIRITDSASSQILAITRVHGQASDISAGAMAGLLSKDALSGVLSVYADTSMGKAIRICIVEAVHFATQNIPESHFKY